MVYNISYEVASAAFLVILYMYIRLQYSHKSQANKEFERLTIYMLVTNVSDVVSAITISYGSQLPRWINWITNSIYFISVIYLGYQFTVYSRACVKRKEMELASGKDAAKEKKNYIAIVNKWLMFLYFGIFVVNLFTGLIFGIGENGEYIHGPLYYSVHMLSYYYIMCAGITMFKNHKKFGKRQMGSVLIYSVIAFIGPILQMLEQICPLHSRAS